MELSETIFDLDDIALFSFDRNKEDYIKQGPSNPASLNKAGEIRIELNNQQHYISLSESFFMCEFNITKGDGTDLGNDNITLENNFFPRMFSAMRIEIGGREIENIAQALGE